LHYHSLRQRTSSARAQRRESGVYLAFSRRVEDLDPKAQAAGGRLHVANERRGGRIGRMCEHGEVGNLGTISCISPSRFAASAEPK
jgi:hypothetical protein